MYLSDLELVNFRVHQKLKISALARKNLFLGQNGQGKTSILEAIHLLFGSRRASYEEMISFHQNQAAIRGRVFVGSGKKEISLLMERGRPKRIKVNKKPAPAPPKELKAVFFHPDDLLALKGSPGRRRDLIDEIWGQADPKHLYWLRQYNASLRQRNALLKQGRADDASLEAYSQKLVEAGAKVILARVRALTELAPSYRGHHKEICGSSVEAGIIYKTELDVERPEQSFWQALGRTREEERTRGQTLIGPHLDDFCFHLSEMDLRRFGSQGEKRVAALSLRLAQHELLSKLNGVTPVVLMDDLMSELDKDRRRYLLGAIDHANQVIFTATDEALLKRGIDSEVKIYNL